MKKLFFVFILIFASAPLWAEDFFPISFWYPPNEITEETMAEVADANFTLAFVNNADQKKVLDLCQEKGMKVLIYDYETVLKNLDENNYKGRLDELASKYSSHPALWGYYLSDEPSPELFGKIKQMSDYLRGKDPNHIVFTNLYPNYADKKVLGNMTYDNYLDTYMKTVSPQIMSFDNYPTLKDGERKDYYANLESVRACALKYKVPFVSIVLSTPHDLGQWTSYRDPSEADLRFQVYSALAYGCKGIMYFTYATPVRDASAAVQYGDGIIKKDGTQSSKYNVVKAINREIKNMAPTLLGLESTAVYHTRDNLPTGAKTIPYTNLISTVTGGDFVVAQFKDKNDVVYAMIVNKNLTKKAKADVSFSKNVKVTEVRKDKNAFGESVNVKTSETLYLNIRAGDGILFKVE